MPSKCVISECTSYTSSNKFHSPANKENRISFHRFPKDATQRKKWEERVGSALGSCEWIAAKSAVICSKHFLNDDYLAHFGERTRILKQGAVPSVFAYLPRRNRKSVLSSSTPKGTSSASHVSQQQPPATSSEVLLSSVQQQPGTSSVHDLSSQHHYPGTSSVKYDASENGSGQLQKCGVVRAQQWSGDSPSRKIMRHSNPTMKHTKMIDSHQCKMFYTAHYAALDFSQFKPLHISTPIETGKKNCSPEKKNCQRSLFKSPLEHHASELCFSETEQTSDVNVSDVVMIDSVDSERSDENDICTIADDDTPKKKALKDYIAEMKLKLEESLKTRESLEENMEMCETEFTKMKACLFEKEQRVHVLKNENTNLKSENQKLKEKSLYDTNIKDAAVFEKDKAEKRMRSEAITNQKLKKQIKCLKQKVAYSKKLIKSNLDVIQHLKDNKLVNTDALEMLQSAISPGAASMLKRVKTWQVAEKRGKHNEFDPSIRAFALTLHFYSPRAYNYIRDSFAKALPHPKTLSKWMSHVTAGPGFTKEAFNVISARVQEAEKLDKKVKLALLTDDISLKEGIHFDGSRIHGYVDLGIDCDGDSATSTTEQRANHACVYMVVSINDNWKLPVAYFLVKSLTGADRAEITKECILKLEATGAQVESLTFDGTACNVTMAKELGAKLADADDLIPSFPNPADPTRRISTVLDACHMIKLVRNCLAEKGIMYDSQQRAIRWSYLEELHKLQTDEGLKLANRLAKRHINWKRAKMKVRVAVQTFSSSVADALEYCEMVLQLPQFEGAQATVDFIRKFDKLFDILNSSSPVGTYLKAPLKPENVMEKRQFILESCNYIKNLTVTRFGGSLLKTDRKTGFLGMIVSSKCMLELYDRLVDGTCMKYLLTYKFSQDHLEMFFSLIRQKGGWNNNPMCHQFRSAYRSLLLHNEIKHVATGNCVSQSVLQVLTSSSRGRIPEEQEFSNVRYEGALARFRIREGDGDEFASFTCLQEEHDYHIPAFQNLSRYCENVVEYIAGFVVQKLEQSVECQNCRASLLADYDAEEHSYPFIVHKDRGGLTIPSWDVVRLCKITEQCYREASSENLNSILAMKLPQRVVLFARENSLFSCLDDHVRELGFDSTHYSDLVCAVVSYFLKIRLHHDVRTMNQAKDDIRTVYNRLVIDGHY